MQARSRFIQIAVAAIVTALSLTSGPAALVRPVAAAAPTDLCRLLTPDEIATALKVEAADGSGGDQFCSWYMGGTELDILVDAGSLEATRAGTSGYVDVTVAGRPALLAAAGDTWLVIGIDSGTLSLHLFSDPGTGVDVATAVEALGAVALGRMTGLGVAPATPTPAPTAGPLCGILTADEVSAVLSEQVTVVESIQDMQCDYLTRPDGGGGSLTLYQTTTTLAEYRLSPFISPTDVVVAGQPGLVDSHNPSIFVETPGGWTLEMHLFSDVVDNATAATALQTLAATALGRSSDFPLVVATSAPIPTSVADPDLAALFPATVGGQPFPVRALTDDELSAYYEVMAELGMGMDDITFALGENAAGSVMAVRTNGWSAADVEQDFLPALAGDMADPQQTPTVVADRAVIKVTDGPDPVDAGGLTIATSDDVIWAITAQEPSLSEILLALPLPPAPPPSSEPSPAS